MSPWPTVSGLQVSGQVVGVGGGGGDNEQTVRESPAWRGYVSGLYAAMPAPPPGATEGMASHGVPFQTLVPKS